MEPKPFPVIPYECPRNCPPAVDQAAFLLSTAAINGDAIPLSVILQKCGITDSDWRNTVRAAVQSHFPQHVISPLQTGLSGPRPLTLVVKKS